MLNLRLDLQPQTENRLHKILNQYKNHENFVQKIIENEILDLEKAIGGIRLDLKKFEERHNISTSRFYRKFENGEYSDDEDTIIWAGIYEMLLENQQRLMGLQ